MKNKKTKTVKVNYIARVEGEGALSVDIEEGKVTGVKLKIFEPPRFFEALLRGRDFREAPDITSRICGICPIAYQMSAVNAMEDALGVQVDEQLGQLRRLLYCGEWIESHGLHLLMLHAPDFLGFTDAIAMAKQYRKEVERGLRLKKAGNSIVSFLGGREIHPINVRVGGFYKLPKKSELTSLSDELKWGRESALDTVKWVAGFEFPHFEEDYEFVSLVDPGRYPMEKGHIQSSKGLNIPVNAFNDHVEEMQVPHSNALQARIKARGSYLTGPLARYHLNFDSLSPLVKETAQAIGFPKSCRNPFKSIIVRSLEILYAFEEAIRIIEGYEKPEKEAYPLKIRAATGFGCTEAPRGLLFHRYEFDDKGLIKIASIIPPTSQNQMKMEEDLLQYIKSDADLPEDELAAKCERFIRNYDPCISCATHFLKLKVNRR